MANSYTPEEIEELKAREADEIKRLGQATVETRMALIDMAAGTKGITASLTKGFSSLGTSAMDLSKQLYNGQTGLSVFNNSIGAVSDALGDLVGLIPYVGPLFKGLIKGAGDYTKAVNLHADQLYKSYQEMSQIGATTAGGVSDLYDNLKRMNYSSTTEMGVFTSLVRENSLTLSNFGKTVGSGLTEIAKVSEAIQDGGVGRQFLLMGMSVDDINRGIIGFTKMQMLTGGRQKMTTDELISASENYIKEIDLLAKITGKDRASQEKSRESAMAEERYAALTYELQQRANMGDEAAKAQLITNERIQQQLEKDAPGLRKGFLNILSGTINTPEAKQMALAMPRAAAVAQKKFFTQAEYEEAVREDLTRNLKGTGDQIVGAGVALGQIGAYGPTFGSLNEQIKYLATLEQGTFEQRKAQADKEKIVTDKATQSIVDTNIQNRKTRDTLQDLIHYGIVPVTGAMKTAAGATNSLTEAFESAAKKLGVNIKQREAEPAPSVPRAVGASSGTVLDKIIQAESGGRNIPNQSGAGGRPTSSAFGIAQMTKGTFEGLVKLAQPGNALYGKTFDDMKADVGLQHEALTQLTTKNKSTLELAKVSTSDAAVYLAHFLGAAGATKVLKLPNTAPLTAGVSDAQIEANPMLQKMATIGDLKAWADQKMGGGGYATPVTATPAANGGVIRATPGGVNVLAAEAGKNEAFVPLPDGKSIPVQMVNNEQQMSMMAAQLDRLDQMVRIMQNQVGVSEKILKYAQ